MRFFSKHILKYVIVFKIHLFIYLFFLYIFFIFFDLDFTMATNAPTEEDAYNNNNFQSYILNKLLIAANANDETEIAKYKESARKVMVKRNIPGDHETILNANITTGKTASPELMTLIRKSNETLEGVIKQENYTSFAGGRKRRHKRTKRQCSSRKHHRSRGNRNRRR